jgi:hypothetical protein
MKLQYGFQLEDNYERHIGKYIEGRDFEVLFHHLPAESDENHESLY